MKPQYIQLLLTTAAISLSAPSFAACYSSPNLASACRYPAGDQWCATNKAAPYAYNSACMAKKNKTVTPVAVATTKRNSTQGQQAIKVYVASIRDDISTYSTKYAEGLAQTGWGKILDVQRIQKDGDFSESNAIITSARNTLKTWAGTFSNYTRSWSNKLQQLPVSTAEKTRLAKRLNTWIQANTKEYNLLIAKENASLSQVAGIIELLKNNKSLWSVGADNNISFKDTKLQTAISDKFKAIEKLSKESRAINERIKKSAAQL